MPRTRASRSALLIRAWSATTSSASRTNSACSAWLIAFAWNNTSNSFTRASFWSSAAFNRVTSLMTFLPGLAPAHLRERPERRKPSGDAEGRWFANGRSRGAGPKVLRVPRLGSTEPGCCRGACRARGDEPAGILEPLVVKCTPMDRRGLAFESSPELNRARAQVTELGAALIQVGTVSGDSTSSRSSASSRAVSSSSGSAWRRVSVSSHHRRNVSASGSLTARPRWRAERRRPERGRLVRTP